MPEQQLFLKYFFDRGIRIETVSANGVRLADRDETAKAVGELLPAIRWDYGGNYQRYRFLGDPDLFPKNEKGKPIKCKAKKGSGNRLYVPRRAGVTAEDFATLKSDPAVPLVVVEGEADTLGVLQAEEGSIVTGVSGCFGWRSKDAPLLPELRELALPGRAVVLCPDSDWEHNRNVFNGWSKLGVALKQIGCTVQVTVVESSPDNKLGAGDFIHHHGAEAWKDLDRIPLTEWQARGHELHKQRQQNLDDPNQEPRRKKESAAELLIHLALELGSFWHDSTGAGWVDFSVDGVLQTARIRSKRFRDFLSRVLWERESRSINSESWSQAAGTLEGLARFDHPEREAFLRVGQHQGAVYIDLGSPNWSIVHVAPDGWQVIPYSSCPIRFYRSECQLPLPSPTRGGALSDLWKLLNFKEADRPLVLGWLLSCLVPDGAKPILALSGEKGSGKSSAATLLKRLTDPTKVSKASAVGDSRQMASAAMGRWVLSFDNLTYLSTEQQDLLCCVSTGAGFSHRTLYTDLDETFLEYRRPQILTGVDLVPTRSDLLDRSLIVRLERIPEEDRLPEAELERLTQQLLPGIYGALLDLLATAIRNLPTTHPAKLPRMADFAKLCLASGIPGFGDAYATNIEAGCQAAIEANPVTAGILALLEAHNGYWQGSSSELIKRLQELDPASRDFQKLSARSIGRKLASSLRGDLAAIGIEVDQGKGSHGQRFLILSRARETQKITPQTPQTPYPSQGKGFSGGVTENKTPPITPPNATHVRDSGSEGGVMNHAGGVMENKTPPVETSRSKAYGVGGVSGVFLASLPDVPQPTYLAAQNSLIPEPVELDPSDLIEEPDDDEEDYSWVHSLRR
jgi:hypothetical protein